MESKNLGKNLIKKATHVLNTKDSKIKAITKKVTITITAEQQEKARDLSVLVLGKENISGLIGYMINKLDKEYKS